MPQFLNDTFRNWQGQWIFNSGSSGNNSYTYFREEFTVTDPEKIFVYITADTRYRLYINGTYVRTGPVQSQPYNTYYDEEDITPYLSEGRNCLAVEVYYGGHIKDSHPGFLFEIEDSNHRILCRSSSHTRSLHAGAWASQTYGISFINRYAPYQEFFDARLEPLGWKLPGFDDSEWNPSNIVSGRNRNSVPQAQGGWTKISRRPLPDMKLGVALPKIIAEEECLFIMNRFRADDLSISLSQPGHPVHFTSIDHEEHEGRKSLALTCSMDDPYGGMYNPALLLDFGTEITAYLELELDGHAGQTIEIGYAERLVDGYFNNVLECPFADRYTLKEGKQTFRSFNWRGYRYVRLIFKDCEKPIHVLGIRGITTQYPFDFQGGFTSSDRELQDVFNICRHTIELCCNESIVDTPWREQSQWMGDVAAVTLGGIYSLYGDTRLPWKFLSQSAANQLQTGFISNTTNTTDNAYQKSMIDYNFWWVISVWQYYMYSGDRRLLTHIYPVICRLMQAADDMRDEYGMLNRASFVIFFDWAPNDSRGESCGLNAIYYGALKVFLKMAELKHDDDMKAMADDAIHMIEKNFSSRFFSEEKGVFIDANVDDVPSSVISEGCNMLPIYFGLADSRQAESSIRHIIIDRDIDFVEACPFLALYTLRALSNTGHTELALQMIRDKWYARFIGKGGDSTTEEWDMNGSYRNGKFLPIMRSLSHAWSAGPAEYLVKDLNHIEILEPGGTKIRMSPHLLDHDYTVTYPTPAGNLNIRQESGKISWSCSNNMQIVIH